eukprot:TRINITY_DN4344_c0_g1_i5.p2 TRINITY_DN4344_c0_g1~~TRINITY_DN4344_c0_g1_i5.p2  ORF type:complete len:396 (-),score=52.69 TRINITY_DN4344_c0_g1_i5:2446-3633(-)
MDPLQVFVPVLATLFIITILNHPHSRVQELEKQISIEQEASAAFKNAFVNNTLSNQTKFDISMVEIQNVEQQILYMRGLDSVVRNKTLLSDNLKNVLLQNHDSYVGLCVMVRDEHPFIREWITYHNYIGVDKFYVYDHLSLPPVAPLIQDFIMTGLVDYQYVNMQWLKDDYNLDARPFNYNGSIHVNSPQRWVHLDCFLKHQKNHQFMAMMDVDEFIVLNQGMKNDYMPVEQPDLPGYLQSFEHTGGIFMQWRHFGSSGHVTRPQGLVLESYTQCEAEHNSITKHLKTIKHMVNMNFLIDMCIIHTCLTTVPSVNTEFIPAPADGHVPESWEGLVLNHYIYKSQEDFKAKQLRGGGHMNLSKYRKWRSFKDFQKVDNRTSGNCTYMIDLANACCK